MELNETIFDREALFEDLLEQAYLDALIDGEQQTLAYYWLRANHQSRVH